MKRAGCEFSPDRLYRYTLWREWDRGLGYVQVIGLNPSAADETKNDPTVRRCIDFAKTWGFGALCMTNIFAFRSTLPAVMRRTSDPIGSLNDSWLCVISKSAALVVAAWGIHGGYMSRGVYVQDMLSKIPGVRVQCLGITSEGFPKHPLYLRKDSLPVNL